MKFLNNIQAMFRKIQAKKYKQTSEQKLDRDIDKIEIHSQKGIAAQEKMGMMEDKLNIHKKSYPEFVNVDPSHHCIVIIAVVGVILSNYSLTRTSLSTILDNYGDKNTWFPVVFPIFLISFELLFAIVHPNLTQQTTDKIEKIKTENNKNWIIQIFLCSFLLYVLRFVMGIMVLITPIFLLATIIAADGFNSTHEFINSSGLMFLAVVTDFVIVIAGERILKSIAFVVFHCKRWQIQGKIDKYQKSSRTSAGKALRSLRRYRQALGQYNRNLQEYNQEYSQQNNPIPDMEEVQFRPDIANFLNQGMDIQENQRTFPPPQQPQDQYRATNTPPSNNPVDTNREEIDEPETEPNYFDLNIRDAEREVDGD
ncbi:hypothetical protein NIES267_41420 [Calothrix parasitica NIES-267]|uniref:Transmembrane protein n=1 Tax=Calothrix parasitica NIES-267 TaxID=1973488 RepID=A0A1Z4LTS8_9CYAN|nr:hypothetical protein NIES267_41420 [Calothrix parasitica NIES-267]